jgi:hypothetical protein
MNDLRTEICLLTFMSDASDDPVARTEFTRKFFAFYEALSMRTVRLVSGGELNDILHRFVCIPIHQSSRFKPSDCIGWKTVGGVYHDITDIDRQSMIDIFREELYATFGKQTLDTRTMVKILDNGFIGILYWVGIMIGMMGKAQETEDGLIKDKLIDIRDRLDSIAQHIGTIEPLIDNLKLSLGQLSINGIESIYSYIDEMSDQQRDQFNKGILIGVNAVDSLPESKSDKMKEALDQLKSMTSNAGLEISPSNLSEEDTKLATDVAALFSNIFQRVNPSKRSHSDLPETTPRANLLALENDGSDSD